MSIIVSYLRVRSRLITKHDPLPFLVHRLFYLDITSHCLTFLVACSSSIRFHISKPVVIRQSHYRSTVFVARVGGLSRQNSLIIKRLLLGALDQIVAVLRLSVSKCPVFIDFGKDPLGGLPQLVLCIGFIRTLIIQSPISRAANAFCRQSRP